MDPLSTAAAGAGPGLSQGLMPPAAPLAMPVQDLTKAPAAHHAPRRDPARPLRWAALGGAVALHLTLVALLGWWLAEDGLSPLDMALIALVGLVGLWLALAASTALVGLLPETAPPGGPSTAGHGLQVALLIPVYHEDPDAVAARALAMLRDIAAHRRCTASACSSCPTPAATSPQRSPRCTGCAPSPRRMSRSTIAGGYKTPIANPAISPIGCAAGAPPKRPWWCWTPTA